MRGTVGNDRYVHKITAYQYKVEGACEICRELQSIPSENPQRLNSEQVRVATSWAQAMIAECQKNIGVIRSPITLLAGGNDICSHIRINEAIQIKSASVHEPAQLIEAIAIKE